MWGKAWGASWGSSWGLVDAAPLPAGKVLVAFAYPQCYTVVSAAELELRLLPAQLNTQCVCVLHNPRVAIIGIANAGIRLGLYSSRVTNLILQTEL